MIRVISIITPSCRPVPAQLTEAYDSLRRQDIPQGWEWEWIIQEDGDTGVVKDILPEDSRIILGTGRRGGVAITRNLALARSRGELVKNLDQDDILTPGVIARDIKVLEENPAIQWTTSRVLDLLPDGSTIGFDNDPPAGRLERGFVVDHWVAHNYRLPVHPTTICIRRSLAVALGGWMAVPGSEDTGLLTAASVVSSGHFHREVGLLYRKWPGQATADLAHTEPGEWNLRMGLIRERAESMAKIWRL